MLVVDLRHWMLPNGDLAPRARLAPHVARIVECATAIGDSVVTSMLCRHHRTRRRCMGQIGVGFQGETVMWSCTDCDDAGAITGWRSSNWDLSRVDMGGDGDLCLYVPLDELRALRDLDLSPPLRAVLAMAPVVGDRAFVALSETEASTLRAAVESASIGGQGRRLLDRVHGRLDQLLAAHQVPRRARAH